MAVSLNQQKPMYFADFIHLTIWLATLNNIRKLIIINFCLPDKLHFIFKRVLQNYNAISKNFSNSKLEIKSLVTLGQTKGILNLEFIIITDYQLVLGFKLIKGMTLTRFLKSPELKKRDIYTVFGRLNQIVRRIHKKKITHCDLRMKNILVNSSNEVTLFEFSCSRKFQDRQDLHKCHRLGTLHYLAPEYLKNQKINCKSLLFWNIYLYLKQLVNSYITIIFNGFKFHNWRFPIWYLGPGSTVLSDELSLFSFWWIFQKINDSQHRQLQIGISVLRVLSVKETAEGNSEQGPLKTDFSWCDPGSA